MSTVTIKSMKDLERAMELRIIEAMKQTQKIIDECIQESINEYYNEYTPSSYRRIYKFLDSLVSTDIIKIGNAYQCEVRIKEDYLDYNYPNQLNTSLPATGLDVVQWANRDIEGYFNHGGTIDAGRDEGFWDIAMNELGGDEGILEILKDKLKLAGLPVK